MGRVPTVPSSLQGTANVAEVAAAAANMAASGMAAAMAAARRGGGCHDRQAKRNSARQCKHLPAHQGIS